jgi:predicted secreted protein
VKKQTLFALAFTVLLAVAAAACASDAKGDNTNSGKQIAVNESQSGKQIDAAKGDVIKITLDSNVTTGYQWSLVSNSNESVLSLTDHGYVSPTQDPSRPIVGAGGYEEWYFAALASGTSTLHMEYSRPWEETTPPARSFGLIVVVK